VHRAVTVWNNRGVGICRQILALVVTVACLGCTSTRAPEPVQHSPASRHYDDVSLFDLVRYPRAFDGDWVRVQGVAQVQFENTSLSVDARSDQGPERAVWLHLGWPLPSAVAALDASVVVVEARFDANERGHAGMFQGMLTDVRAVWRPEREAEAYAPRYETRIDALEQLEHKTGWVWLGVVDEEGRVDAGDGSTATLVPARGDRLRVPRRMRIHIADYATTGEARRAELPSTGSGDATRLWIAPGTLAIVDDVRVAASPPNEVWARLSPVSRTPGR
jgi:hypothetical protein